jgi:hypothetical protein
MSEVAAKYSTNVGAGLDLWVKFAKSIRIYGRNGAKYPPFGENTSALTDYYKVISCFMQGNWCYSFYFDISFDFYISCFNRTAHRACLLSRVSPNEERKITQESR